MVLSESRFLKLPPMSKDLHVFYMPELNEDKVQTMTGIEAGHAIRVLRLRSSDEILITDGRGREVRALIGDTSKKSFDFEIVEENSNETQRSGFHLAIAPTKNMDRLEWCIEKCTEIGLSRVSLILCQNSERRKVRIDRLEKVAISAMKQSMSTFLPEIKEVVSFQDFFNDLKDEQVLIAHCRESEKGDLKNFELPACLLIGPEGDFTEDEIELALSSGAKPVHLGPKRLRTETAAVVACTLMNL